MEYLIDEYAVIYSPLAIMLKQERREIWDNGKSFCTAGSEKPEYFSQWKNILKAGNNARHINIYGKKEKMDDISKCGILQLSSPVYIDFEKANNALITSEDESIEVAEFADKRNALSLLVISDYAEDMPLEENSIRKSALTASLFGNGLVFPLWNINEKTKNSFLEEFYRNLYANDFDISRGEVTRFAKKKIKETVISNEESPHSVSLSHPYFWASFIQSGR